MSLVESGSLFPDIPSSTDVLVSGPPISGKTSLAMRCLVERADGVVVLTTHRSPSKFDDAFLDGRGDTEAFRIVDCSGTPDERDDSPHVIAADGPSNMTSAGVLTTAAIADVEDAGTLGVGVCSLSDLLSYHDTDTVCRFVDAMKGTLDESGFVVGVLNDQMHEETAVAALTDKFDVVVETRADESGREMRLRDSEGYSAWQDF